MQNKQLLDFIVAFLDNVTQHTHQQIIPQVTNFALALVIDDTEFVMTFTNLTKLFPFP